MKVLVGESFAALVLNLIEGDGNLEAFSVTKIELIRIWGKLLVFSSPQGREYFTELFSKLKHSLCNSLCVFSKVSKHIDTQLVDNPRHSLSFQ